MPSHHIPNGVLLYGEITPGFTPTGRRNHQSCQHLTDAAEVDQP